MQKRCYNHEFKNDGGYNLLRLAVKSNSLKALRYLMKVYEKYSGYKGKDDYQYKLLRLVVEENVLDAVEFLVTEEKIDVDVADAQGYTLLHLAAKKGYLDIVELLVNSNAKINIKDNNGNTPLDLANEGGKTEVADFLTAWYGKHDKYSPNPAKSENLSMVKGSRNNGNGISDEKILLHLAAKDGHIKVIQFLIKNGAEVNIQDNKKKTPLHLAAKKGRLEIAQFLVGSGANIHAQDDSKRTPLHLAAENGRFDVANFLVSNSANINVQDNKKKTPLHLAAENDRIAVVQLLVKNRANINIQDSDDRTSLHLAAENGHWNIVQFLVSSGASINVQDKNGETPFHLAASNSYKAEHSQITRYLFSIQVTYNQNLFSAASSNDLGIVKDLLSNNRASIHAQDDSKRTPLHLAAENGHTRVVQFLLGKDASIRVQYNGQNVPVRLVISSSDKHNKIVEMLREKEEEYDNLLLCAAFKGCIKMARSALNKGANVNAEYDNNNLQTPLHLATHGNFLDVVTLLVNKRCDINNQRRDGCTALHIAASQDYTGIVKFLLDRRADVALKDHNEKTPLDLVLDKLNENPESENYETIRDLLVAQQNPQIQSSKKQQKSLLFLSKYIDSHFHGIELKAVEQGLYLPSFEKRGVKMALLHR